MAKKTTTKKAEKRAPKSEKKVHTIDSLTKAVREISTSRKIELEEDPELSKAICDLADFAGDTLSSMLDEAIQNQNDADKKKNMLLVLQLLYLKMSSEILDAETKIELTSEIPTSGFVGVKPIEAGSIPMYI